MFTEFWRSAPTSSLCECFVSRTVYLTWSILLKRKKKSCKKRTRKGLLHLWFYFTRLFILFITLSYIFFHSTLSHNAGSHEMKGVCGVRGGLTLRSLEIPADYTYTYIYRVCIILCKKGPTRPNGNEIITRRWACVDCSYSASLTGKRILDSEVR